MPATSLHDLSKTISTCLEDEFASAEADTQIDSESEFSEVRAGGIDSGFSFHDNPSRKSWCTLDPNRDVITGGHGPIYFESGKSGVG